MHTAPCNFHAWCRRCVSDKSADGAKTSGWFRETAARLASIAERLDALSCPNQPDAEIEAGEFLEAIYQLAADLAVRNAANLFELSVKAVALRHLLEENDRDVQQELAASLCRDIEDLATVCRPAKPPAPPAGEKCG